MKIIVDAMGGDHAPEVVIEGTVEAVKEYNIEVVLVGNQDIVEPILKKFKYDKKLISVHHAFETIEMHEPAATSVRRKRDSSIVAGLNLVRDGQGDAFFSAGNTGAVVCAATLSLRMLSTIERPGIAIIFPTLKGTSMVIDVGANIDPKPIQMLQYGIMADLYCKHILGKSNPKVGLLNVGEEETKGTDFVKETFELLEKSHINFIGNVEGKEIFSGECDVIVCDGFVGNVVLKVSESLAEALQIFLKRHILNSFKGKIGALLLKDNFRHFKKEIDYSEYGGAPLLGVDGVVLIGHGRSNAKAIKNAIRAAKEEVDRKFNEKIVEALSDFSKSN